jgi:membrane fusion protein (multidrug efflux system)
MKKNYVFTMGLLMLPAAGMFFLIAGCTSDGSESRNPNAQRSATRGFLVEATVLKPRELLNKIYTTGTILANEEVELRSERTGRVTGIFFDEGSRVQKDQLLVKIDDSELRAQLKKVEIQEKLAGDEEYRKRQLWEMNGLSQEEYDISLNQLKTAQAEKELLQAQIAKTEITAPFGGVIGLRYVSTGGYVSSNTLIATLQEVDPIKIEFSVPEKYGSYIHKGTAITFTLTGSERVYNGTVFAAETRIDVATRTVRVRARSANSDRTLVPGAFAKIEIVLEKIPDALTVPSEAVVPELGGQKVFLFQKGVARSAAVQTGLRTEDEVQITAGVEPGDTLIVTGLLQLRDGLPVEISNLKAE